MKKSLLAVIAALAIAGCSQNDLIDEIDNGNQISKVPIAFNSIVTKASRATVVTGTSFKEFKVYGYALTGDFSGTSTISEYMTDVITKKTTWEGTTMFYWPYNQKLNFFAYSPQNAVTDFTATTGYPTFSYTIGNDASSQIDLLAAEAENQQYNSEAAVSLTFKHILTQINFSVVLAKGFTYEITSITLSNIIGGSATFTYKATDVNKEPGAWGAGTTSTSYVYNTAQTIAATTDDEITDCSANNPLILLPQTLGENAKISIAYKVYDTANPTHVTFEGTKEKAINSGIWGMGKSIRYKLTLPSDANAISFTASDDTWSTETEQPIQPEKPTV